MSFFLVGGKKFEMLVSVDLPIPGLCNSFVSLDGEALFLIAFFCSAV